MNHECSLSLIPGSVSRIQSLDRNWALTHWTPTLKSLMPIFIFSSLLLLLWPRSMGPWRSCGLISSSLPRVETSSQRGGEITPGIHRFLCSELSVSTSTDFYPIICFVKSSWTIIQLLKQCLTWSQYLINTFWLSEWSSHQPILPGTLRQTSSTSTLPLAPHLVEFNWSLLPATRSDNPITCSLTDVTPERTLFYPSN